MAKGVVCFLNAMAGAARSSSFGLLDRNGMEAFLRSQGMTAQEMTDVMKDLDTLYKARAKELKKKNLNKKEASLVNLFYGSGLGSMSATNKANFEAFANAYDIPFINDAEMRELERLAQDADNKAGNEKAVVEDQIRNILDQKDEQYYTRLQSAKVAFKVLLSVGFNVMSTISNRMKYMEMLLNFRLQYAKKGNDGNQLTRFFSPYPLKNWKQINKEHAAQLARGVRGAKGEGMQKFLSALGWSGNQVLQNPLAAFGADISNASDSLEYANEREGNKKWGWLRKLDRKIARTSKRWAASVDAAGKVRIGELHYFTMLFKDLQNQYPTETDQQIIKRVTDNMFSIDRPTAEAQAEQEFLQWGIETTTVNGQPQVNKRSARYLVRVAEIMKSGRTPDMQEAAYNRASVNVWQGRTTFANGTFQNKIDSGVGGIIADFLNAMRNQSVNLVNNLPIGTGAKTFSQNILFNIFGFINGPAAYFEDFLEHNIVYWAMKQTTLWGTKKYGNLTPEEREQVEDKMIELQSKFLFTLVEAAAFFAVTALAKAGCDDSPEDGLISDMPTGKQDAKTAQTQYQKGESSLNACGISIPLEYFGGFSMGSLKMIATLYDRLENADMDTGQAIYAALATTWENGNISPMMSDQPGLLSGLYKAWQERKDDESWAVQAQKQLSASAANVMIQMLPVPNRLIKESVQAFTIPYRTYAPAGEPDLKGNFMYQFGKQVMFGFANSSGINHMAQIFTNQDGLIGRPLFDYRHRPIDAGNLYDGKGIAGLTKPVRQLVAKAKGKDPILYDELDHFLTLNKVALNWDSRSKVTIFKDDDEKKRLLTDDEYYAYSYAQSKAFGEWLQEQWEVGGLKEQTQKELRQSVPRMQSEIRSRILRELEYAQEVGEKLKDPHELYERIR